MEFSVVDGVLMDRSAQGRIYAFMYPCIHVYNIHICIYIYIHICIHLQRGSKRSQSQSQYTYMYVLGVHGLRHDRQCIWVVDRLLSGF